MGGSKSHPHGDKTHQQQIDIIEKRVDTSNAGEDFDIRSDLERSDAAREAHRKGANLEPTVADWDNADDRAMTRGENQESEHHKKRVDD